MSQYILSFNEIGSHNLPEVGGKGANLGELLRVEAIPVPEGFCVMTKAYKKIVMHNGAFNELLDQLSLLKVDDRERIGEIGKKVRKLIEETEIEKNIEKEIIRYITKFGEQQAYAVRSSTTAEDLPLASFAGQQDTYLNIMGIDSILDHIKRCWASLFTDRAVIYRIQNGFDHRKVYLSVVIQRMIFPQTSGIMFTADPVTFNRKVLSIDASFGLGEALVSGLVNADNYKVQEGKSVDKKISTNKRAIYALKKGGTEEREIEQQQQIQTLTDEQILQLGEMGRRIETYFNRPQDIEWCLFEDTFYILQSRPITTIYPIPENDGNNRVYASLGHLQMMTEEIKPLGMSFCQLLSFWFGQNLVAAGGRLFIDGTYDLRSPIGRKILISSTGEADILMENALSNLVERKGFIKTLPKGKGSISMSSGALSWISPAIKVYRKNNLSTIQDIINHNEVLISEMEQEIEKVSGDELFEFILRDTKELKAVLTGPENMSMMVVGGFVSSWINKKMEKWLGEKSAVHILSKSVENNVTTEMGLALLDVSDAVRKYPEVIEYFNHASDDETFFEDLMGLEGGDEVSKEVQAYLQKYGMRCPGEIDITKPRWSEKPTALIPMILSNIKSAELNSSTVKFEEGRLEAKEKERVLLSRLEQLPGGKRKAKKAKKMISVLRNVIGFREYPKYSFIKRFQIYKNALIKEADVLVKKGIILNKEDIYYLSFEELRKVVQTNSLDYSIIRKRKEDYEVYEKLTPPRVMTSDGEVISGAYNNGNMPQGALAGVAVSSGVIEGRAKVVLKLENANIEEGDILVTVFTDPSWTPLFVSVKGLVTEVGGLMTHGAVITREYGIPGVVGVENATKLIKDGQRIRINGTEGYVELL
ncbi:pyruvate phosphate dikinase, PEP/pyruvate-binding [Alkaliphilus metalliredigens QYMF]|uniref:Rifampicin phosphotransferase n=1 Tax=Alkaliphilus metalliredigens (strain QYMF) TaxID=293826 RepID=A6TNE9_ALKMQ|nr:phosphoenolpyruvate synthase [Alkaliphilus metalliredigens]ABR47717.1 pyruvate phosphate dikinase, PEP/pyruvate-binding [Alkaliphilus metalliredigens QYMF]